MLGRSLLISISTIFLLVGGCLYLGELRKEGQDPIDHHMGRHKEGAQFDSEMNSSTDVSTSDPTLLREASALPSKSKENSVSTKSKDSAERTLELGKVEAPQKVIKDEPKVILNDPALSLAWGLKPLEAQKAWEVSQGNKDIKACVIDTGADVFHEDLSANIWINPGESGLDSKKRPKETNQEDDDGNGFVDDVRGWNFVSNNGDLSDHHGHGTHIAGIIGAQAGNGKGIAGIAPRVSLVILKYFDPMVPNTDVLATTVAAIRYSIKVGCSIINYSGGGNLPNEEEKKAIDEARAKGILFVAAAGNERSNSDNHRYYPADYGLDNIISVTAIDPKTQVLPSSNFGVETVDLAAPGQKILSTVPNNSYSELTGTSQATAFVTGAAILIEGLRPNFSYDEVKKYILSTGDQIPGLESKTRTSRRLNLFKALTMLDSSVSVSGTIVRNSPGSFSSSERLEAQPFMVSPDRQIANFAKELEKKIQQKMQAEKKD